MRTATLRCAIVMLMATGLLAAQSTSPPLVKPARSHAPRSTAYLGVNIRDVTPETMDALKLKDDRGVEITMVDQDAPAAKAGLKEHDVILRVNGKPADDSDQLRQMIQESRPGSQLTLSISRDGQAMTMKVTLGRRPAYAWSSPHGFIDVPEINIPPINIEMPGFALLRYSTRSGVMVEDLTQQLGEYFGVRNGEGVLVRSVEKGSAAEAAGLKAGDVIVKVATTPVTCTSDWHHAMRSQGGGSLNLGIVRERREQTLTMRLPERGQGGWISTSDKP